MNEYSAESRFERLIISALERCGGEGVPSRALMREAGISDKNAFYNALDSLETKGDVKVDRDHWVKLSDSFGDVTATLISLSENFGFARPNDGGEDIFIPGSALKGAFVGDELLLTDVRKKGKGPSGRVKRIVNRRSSAVTGTVHITRSGAVVTPDEGVRYDLRVQSHDLHGAKEGDKVVVSPMADGRGDWTRAVVKRIFGSGDVARICADAIIERCGIPTEFPPEVLEEAERISKMTVSDEDIAGRLDLREDPVFTIDGADAKDLDDAICVKKTDSGYELWVHIADVSHYVKAKSALDEEAFTRGTSVYFADRVIPMLPEGISNGVCSLNAGTDKLTFSAYMLFDRKGNMLEEKFAKTVINSKVRGVYKEVNDIFSNTASEELKNKYAPVMEGLKNARELAKLLRENAEQRGEMELSSDETRFVLDENGVCVDLIPRVSGEAEQMIEQMMVSANIAAARTALRADIPFLYRVHESPQPERVAALYELLDRLAVPCRELKNGKPSAKDFTAVLNRVKGQPRESLVSQRILRTMEKARYDHVELGHYGLCLKEYSHFTSPIRRYPDTCIHRILSDLLAGEDKTHMKKKYGAFTENAASESSKNEVRAVTGERAAEDCYMAEYMRAHLGERHTGVISGATPRGIFVKLKNNAEGFVSLDDFENSAFEFDGEVIHRDLRTGRTLMVGEEFGIIVAAADVSTGRIDFVPQEP